MNISTGSNASKSARYWAVDLHVHTPASRDVNEQHYGSADPADVVQAALDARLDAIAVTDHNTAEWCDDVGAAAKDTSLVVLPGVEITTTDGHLLAIWEERAPSRIIDECLVQLGIHGAHRGKLDISANVGLKAAADCVAECGGLAIAAHADQKKGLLAQTVAAYVRATLLSENLAAVELVNLAKVAETQRKVGDARDLAFVRGSDMMLPGKPGHRLEAIGKRRTWIKASRPDLCGLRHAFQDPALRVALADPTNSTLHPRILSLSIAGGFLDGVSFDFSPDLNCLVGGTGTGKSLALECIRFALGQQVDGGAFPHIQEEVLSRLSEALGQDGTVTLQVVSYDGENYVIERSFDDDDYKPCVVRRVLEEGDLVTVDCGPSDVFQISAFSQGEALEYSRAKVGRMALVDAALDLTGIEAEVDGLLSELRDNQGRLLAQRITVAEMEESLGPEDTLKQRQKELAALFDTETVKSQKAWQADDSTVNTILNSIPAEHELELELPVNDTVAQLAGNGALIGEALAIVTRTNEAIKAAQVAVDAELQNAGRDAEELRKRWGKRYQAFKNQLEKELDASHGGKSLNALRMQLERTQADLLEVSKTKKQLAGTERPRLKELNDQREELLEALMRARQRRRDLRRARIKELNRLMEGSVKLDLPTESDRTAFRQKLGEIKVGSRVNDKALKAIAAAIHPAEFAEAMLNGSYASLVNTDAGVTIEDLRRLHLNIEEKDLWEEVLQLQELDTPDTLGIKFKRDSGGYASIEHLAHGEKCTAIIVVLLADGRTPIIVDQPEDALHAPWIEDHLVDRLRKLRGQRQYLFATRSPGIVISADSEQIFTMNADAGSGRVEAEGSLERHDLNKLVLHHLEGGSQALARRHKKLLPSIDD